MPRDSEGGSETGTRAISYCSYQDSALIQCRKYDLNDDLIRNPIRHRLSTEQKTSEEFWSLGKK